jgi:CHAD domain-containing protein
MDADLGYLGALLSPMRDADILARRLDKEVEGLMEADRVGPVRQEVTKALTAHRQAALDAWRQATTDPRYQRTMATLVRWSASTPVRPDAKVGPKRVLAKAQRAVRRRLKKATDAHGLHQTRKAAKRLRYAADLLAPRHPKAAKVARSAKKLQTTLGEHQDLVVASQFIREMATSSSVANGFSYGMLAERLDRRAAEMQDSVLS